LVPEKWERFSGLAKGQEESYANKVTLFKTQIKFLGTFFHDGHPPDTQLED
jgi:hypothetical protein